MSDPSRRQALQLGLAAAVGSTMPMPAPALAERSDGLHAVPREGNSPWPKGIEGQRSADLGDGRYRNPVLAGDHPDPSVLRDGDVYYKVSSSFHYCPGLVIWSSRDLVNWSPVTAALQRPVGSVFAPDLVKHDERYFIYFPAINIAVPGVSLNPAMAGRPPISILVVHADAITGPWSEPVDMQIHDGIDPGHVVGEDGKRYLFLNSGNLVPISDDGLARRGKSETVYSGWPYPEDWVVESFALEGPKMLRRDGWFYMFSAEGGTARPPTSHMVIVARSRSVRGPWENCPHNPIVRTTSAAEPWWSRGHATPVEGPAGDWWLVYHGYENGFRTLGRQMLLEPFEWTADGWPKARGGDLSTPLRKPGGGKNGPHGIAFSGDFTRARLGAALSLYKPEPEYADRLAFDGGALTVRARGEAPAESAPLVIDAGDRSYDLSVRLDLQDGAQGGLLLFYDERFFCGIGSDERRFHAFKMGSAAQFGPTLRAIGRRLFLRVRNRENVATFFYSADGHDWTTHTSFEVSGYNHNVADGFLSLRPALYATKGGSVTFADLRYRAL